MRHYKGTALRVHSPLHPSFPPGFPEADLPLDASVFVQDFYRADFLALPPKLSFCWDVEDT